ncbi:hypothetical protein IWQ62_002052 [Dispira parvispora]|uniref:TRIP4/RQT4 C2HC5-type zinc finger domain-containing protein n=1 Tax=Dispira parvispora TaxID=1520584 RepID=A0A9W8AS67_9FUNG|nr:hypothetical protein IWQ62_002052 [Dispira parvispora]
MSKNDSVANWAGDELSQRLQLPTVEARQLATYLLSLSSPEEMIQQTLDMLGSTNEAITFAQRLVERAKHQKATSSSRQPHPTGSSSSAPSAETSGEFPELERSQTPSSIPSWSSTIPIVRKKPKKSKSKRPTTTPSSSNHTGEPPRSTKAQKSKQAPTTNQPDRLECWCEATRHDLLSNCVNCGRIICQREGPGPCLTCGVNITSKDQQLRCQNQPSTTPNLTDAKGKAGQAVASAAEERKNRLLEYDRTSAQRTQVIDQVSSFQVPDSSEVQWMTPQEKILAEHQQELRRRQEAKLEELQRRGVRMMSLDLEQGQVTQRQLNVDDLTAEPLGGDDESEVLPPALDKHLPQLNRVESTTGTGYYAVNPRLRDQATPRYVGKGKAAAKVRPKAESTGDSFAQQRVASLYRILDS